MSVRVIARLDIKGPNLVKGIHSLYFPEIMAYLGLSPDRSPQLRDEFGPPDRWKRDKWDMAVASPDHLR
jgi:hypothetical protein